MSLLQGDPLPNITTTKSTTTSGPEWYNQYLQNLSTAGTNAMNLPSDQLVAGFSPLQEQAFADVPGAVGAGTGALSNAENTASLAAKGITPDMVQSYMNPYTSNVVDEMGRLTQKNLQTNLLPSLKGAFAGTGGFGSSRMMGALGQMGADVQANLTGQQAKELESGYNTALTTAGTQAGLLRQAADTQKGIGTAQQTDALAGLNAEYNMGANQQKLDQQRIDAPLTTATNAANVFQNVKVPSTVDETANAPIPGAYSTSPLAQIAGLGSLFASGAGGTSAISGLTGALGNLGNSVKGLLTPTTGNVSFAGTDASGNNLWFDSNSGSYKDASGADVPINWNEG